jgi:hypothetical protein
MELCLILQQNIQFIKVEPVDDDLNEEDSTDMKTDDAYIPSPFSINNVEHEVNLVFS